jgi:hypothetical protein
MDRFEALPSAFQPGVYILKGLDLYMCVRAFWPTYGHHTVQPTIKNASIRCPAPYRPLARYPPLSQAQPTRFVFVRRVRQHEAPKLTPPRNGASAEYEALCLIRRERDWGFSSNSELHALSSCIHQTLSNVSRIPPMTSSTLLLGKEQRGRRRGRRRLSALDGHFVCTTR